MRMSPALLIFMGATQLKRGMGCATPNSALPCKNGTPPRSMSWTVDESGDWPISMWAMFPSGDAAKLLRIAELRYERAQYLSGPVAVTLDLRQRHSVLVPPILERRDD